ncbi:Heat shock factor [Hyphodiscus hymeniophilus]|uniref:Heat shock factor n=1 Tax=Hyphodiscus hymeniophilus TaxID=353542 RepID=A0A9P7AWA6_9HELO|nr:Heat shock factor [Hyphodiscus hymeniophilus]
MYTSMPPTNSRKRPVPGSAATVQTPQMQQGYSAPVGTQADYMRWDQGANNASYPEPPAGYNSNNYGSNTAISQAQYDQSSAGGSTQLARRSINRQLVPTAQRMTNDNSGDQWLGEDSMFDPQTSNGLMEENDSIELLEERATAAKRDAQSKRKQIPPFVQKLSSFLDDGKNTELIRWSDRGDSFVVLDEDEFAKKLIPELFKHNNYASFVRQLNMYGFHKRVGLSDNSMKASERKNKSPSEYYNPYFKRNHPNLLWLINKPKGGTSKSKSKRVKGEEAHENDSDAEGADGIEEVYNGSYANNLQNARAISATPESGPLQRREMAVVQSQLADIQKQQNVITNAIQRLRKDHNQLYQQAVAFQTLHDRHESSINAILTFLATVYNRSLDGQGLGPQNIAQMFANGIPQDQQQQQGNVVDIGDLSNQQQQQHPGSLSPRRRQQRLLMAPNDTNGRANTISPLATPQSYANPQHGAVEELFDSPSDTTNMKMEAETPLPQQGMMNLINNTNARAHPNDGKAEQFPAILTQYENANGNSPLTSEQRNTMLNLMATTSSVPDLGYTEAEIDELVRMQASQDEQIKSLRASIEPLSPSGSIPGLTDGTYFNGHDASDPNSSNLDLDQFLNTDHFYNGSSPIGGSGNFDYGNFGDQNMGVGESHFDLGMDGAGDGGRIVETAGSSEVGTPNDGGDAVDDVLSNGGLRSPIKRRRKN